MALQEHQLEAKAIVDAGDRAAAFLANSDEQTAVGFAELSLRHDYVNGCRTSPVAFVEGLYVLPDRRRLGIARLLYAAAERWAVDLGCSELAVDTDVGNVVSQRVQRALGFEETERVVFYRKQLR